jgi:hypothetical protein
MAEPPSGDGQFGRVSCTQYEPLYASAKGKKIWYLFLDGSFPADPHEKEETEKRKLLLANGGLSRRPVFVSNPCHESFWRIPKLSCIVILNLITNLSFLYHKPQNPR